jgi:uncharacterized protein (TIGR02757 family)
MTSTCITTAGQREDLRAVLDNLYARYNRRELIPPDPLQFVYKYSKPADMELAGFLAASLAYGRVEQIENDLTDLFSRMGKSPFDFVMGFTNKNRGLLKDFKHRFNTGDDIADLITLLQKAIAESGSPRFTGEAGSIEKYFMKFYDGADENVIAALSRFCDSLLDMYRSANSGRRSKGLEFLLAGPGRGGAAKRLNMFLRWMVRSDDVDPGLWQNIDKSKLVVPVDVHIGRLCRILGFHNRANVTLKTALDITRNFAEIEPADPVKYDFSVSRIGILEDCTGRCREKCEFCELFKWCSKSSQWRK